MAKFEKRGGVVDFVEAFTYTACRCYTCMDLLEHNFKIR